MTNWLRYLRSRPWLAVSLMLPGLLLRSAIPPGFMPSASAKTPFAMEMCPGHVSAPAPVVQSPATGESPSAPPPRHHEAPCVFAAAAGLAPTPTVACVQVVIGAPETLVRVARHVAPVRAPLRAHAARAPPFLA